MSQNLFEQIRVFGNEEIEDILIFIELNKKPPLPKLLVKQFDLNLIDEEHCELNFRFRKEDLPRLQKCLGIPKVIICGNRLKTNGLEGLCILLRRLAYPNRYSDLMKIFPRTRCELSRIFNCMIQLLKKNHGRLLKKINQPYLSMEEIRKFAIAIHKKGSPYKNCIGFLDGTVRSMCRPTHNQKLYYNGHKRTHSIKFQSVMFPNGLIGALHGPIQGRRHDAFILQNSKLMEEMQESFYDQNGDPFFLYGDPAYPLKRHLIVPFKSHNINRVKHICNKKMSQVRQSVEWGFGKMIQIFAYLDFKKNLKMGLQNVADYYIVGCLLTNCHTCLYDYQTSDYFKLSPPTLEEYLCCEK